MTDTPEDWVLIEAAKRGEFVGEISDLRHSYESIKVFRALCDMIAKHEQKPVDRKLLCAEEAWEQTSRKPKWTYADLVSCAIELWESGFGK